MLGVLWLCLLGALGLAVWHGTWLQAMLVGGGTVLLAHILYALIRGSLLFRCFVAAAFMVMSALHINQAQGTLEMHFSIFVLLAFLIIYRDWRPNRRSHHRHCRSSPGVLCVADAGSRGLAGSGRDLRAGNGARRIRHHRSGRAGVSGTHVLQ
ncbi:hypothetical protein LO767_18405 [Halopseudomonas aestusnigri]|uniref:hypothetical protein n=1 Tax=Halopseudomonas aestusnigri TaxID=857252 RepID=UPI001E40E209|nr:hypothetical protein [Halopseudomonas aestusnigri]UGV30894.1 hypothetical protein LO767_18405 [Halopseudomonas aestusnigri]